MWFYMLKRITLIDDNIIAKHLQFFYHTSIVSYQTKAIINIFPFAGSLNLSKNQPSQWFSNSVLAVLVGLKTDKGLRFDRIDRSTMSIRVSISSWRRNGWVTRVRKERGGKKVKKRGKRQIIPATNRHFSPSLRTGDPELSKSVVSQCCPPGHSSIYNEHYLQSRAYIASRGDYKFRQPICNSHSLIRENSLGICRRHSLHPRCTFAR